MSRQTTKLERITSFIERNNDLIEGVKCTSLTKNGFNAMEGNQWIVGVKFFTVKGYRNVQFSWYTNASWLEDYYDCENEEPTLKEYKKNILQNLAESLSSYLV